MVRRSKLETYVDVLKILASQGPMKLTQLIDKADLSRGVMRQRLDFLVQRNLVEKQNFSRDKVFYVITERGLRVLNIVVPIIEEARKIPALLY
jgi:predicted transcriptional regulator